MKVKIAVVQFKIEPLEVELNFERIESFIKRASIRKAHIIVFPEVFIAGPIEHAKEHADVSGQYKKRLSGFAKKYSIDIVTGSIIEKYRNRYYNVSYYIDANGKVLTRHKKKHLWDSENDHFVAGKGATIVDTAYGKIGILICWDMAFADMWQKMLKEGVEIVFCPSYWSYGDAGKGIRYNSDAEVEFINSMCISKTFTNETAVVFCNAAKNKQPLRYTPIGRSQIAVPFKGSLKRLDHNREEMFVQEIDTKLMEVAEQSYGLRAANG